MEDKFLGFKYKGIHSYNNNLNFQAYIVNEGEDLKFSNSPEFTLETAAPKFGNINYYLGETKESRVITLDLLVKDVTLSQYRRFVRWITDNREEDENGQQLLIFDYSPNFAYNVKLSSISEGVFYASPNCTTESITYNVEVSIEFNTIGDWAAIGLDVEIMTPGEDYSFSSGMVTAEQLEDGLDSGYYKITNNTNMPLYFNIEVTDFTGDFIIKERVNGEDTVIYSISTGNVQKTFTIYSKYGIALDSSGNFITTTISSVLKIDAGSSKTFLFDETNPGQITPLIREIV